MSALEIATFRIIEDQTDGFVEAYREARGLLTQTPSCRSVRMTRGVEHPDTFVLLVEWDSVEAHLRDFRDSDRYPQWRTLLSPHFAEPPDVVHYHDIDEPGATPG